MRGSIRVLKPGLLATVQDLAEGRHGLGRSGLGAADQVSMRIANLLVGNEQADAVIEFTMADTKSSSSMTPSFDSRRGRGGILDGVLISKGVR